MSMNEADQADHEYLEMKEDVEAFEEETGSYGAASDNHRTHFFYATWGGVDLGCGAPSHPGWYFRHGGICPVGPFESKEAAIKYWQESK